MRGSKIFTWEEIFNRIYQKNYRTISVVPRHKLLSKFQGEKTSRKNNLSIGYTKNRFFYKS